jgi:hypothetical protein
LYHAEPWPITDRNRPTIRSFVRRPADASTVPYDSIASVAPAAPQPSGQTGKQADMATGTSDTPHQPIDTYARLAHLLRTPAPDDETLLDRLHEELLIREARAYAAGWTDALTEARQATRP